MRFNRKTVETKRTVNLAGGEAFTEDPKLEFVSILLTSFVQDQFYRTQNEGLKKVKELMVAIKEKLFLAKAAVYARTKFGMRSISHVVAAELVPLARGQEWLKRFLDKIVYRPDDMQEILAYYLTEYGKPVPNSIKKGFAEALKRYDEYALAKYRGERKDISMVDIINLIHPKPNAQNRKALQLLIEGELKSTKTWESKLTKAGQEASFTTETEEEREEKLAELKKEAWGDLVKKRKIGYFALLRNLRNIIADAPEIVDDAAEMLTDKNLIKKSLVLPFRFVTARDEIQKLSGTGTRKIIKALSDAVDISLDNVPELSGRTLVVLDESGSMGEIDNPKSPISIGSLFAAVLYKKCDADFMGFSDRSHYETFNDRDSVLTIQKNMISARNNGGTNFNLIFQTAKEKYDRIVILSDMQGWMAAADGYYNIGGQPGKTFAAYKKRFGANPFVYSFDLQGYGTLQFPERNVYCLAGFSDKVFGVMKLLEQDRNALVREIEKIEI